MSIYYINDLVLRGYSRGIPLVEVQELALRLEANWAMVYDSIVLPMVDAGVALAKKLIGVKASGGVVTAGETYRVGEAVVTHGFAGTVRRDADGEGGSITVQIGPFDKTEQRTVFMVPPGIKRLK